jgi:hypothetical protein
MSLRDRINNKEIKTMTNNDAFVAFASVIESNPRYMELVKKQDNQTITDEELTELTDIVDDVFFNPFMFKNFMTIDEEDDPEEDARIKAQVEDMIFRGVIGR